MRCARSRLDDITLFAKRALGMSPVPIVLEEVQRLIDDEHAVLVEVLPEREYIEEHLPSATNVPLKELTEERVVGLDRDRPVIVYCWDDT